MPRRDPWYESDNPTAVVRGASWRVGVWIISALVAVAIIGAIGWGISVALSGPKGAGDVHRQNNGVTNRVFAQQHFQDLYAAVTTEDQQLDGAAANARAHPNEAFYQATFDGIQQECIRDRNQYNADANKVLLRDWQSTDLPHQIDPADPKTDCKPTQ